MKLELTVWQRAQAAQCLGQIQPGDVKTFRKASKLLDIFEIVPDKYKELGFTVTDDGQIFGADSLWLKKDEYEIADENDMAFLRTHVGSHLMKLPMNQRRLVADALEVFGVKEE